MGVVRTLETSVTGTKKDSVLIGWKGELKSKGRVRSEVGYSLLWTEGPVPEFTGDSPFVTLL